MATFAAFTTFAHLTVSVFIISVICRGVVVCASVPSAASRLRNSGSCPALMISAFNLATMSAGVPAGTSIPFHSVITTPGKPASATAGRLGAAGERAPPVTASEQSFPAFTSGMPVDRPVSIICTSPATTAVLAGATVGYLVARARTAAAAATP